MSAKLTTLKAIGRTSSRRSNPCAALSAAHPVGRSIGHEKRSFFRSRKRLTLYWKESHFVSLSPFPTGKVIRLPSARCFALARTVASACGNAGAASASLAEPEPRSSCAALSARPATTGSRPRSVPDTPRPTGFVAGAAARRVPAAGRRPRGNPVATASGITWRGSDDCASLNKPAPAGVRNPLATELAARARRSTKQLQDLI